MNSRVPRPWFIDTAITGVKIANRIVAAALNEVLRVRCPALTIETEPCLEGDSLEDAALKFKRALGDLRRVCEGFPEKDSRIWIATLGRINGPKNPRVDVRLDGLMIPGEFESQLTRICDMLRESRTDWTEDNWGEYIVAPHCNSNAELLAFLESIHDPDSFGVLLPNDGLSDDGRTFTWGGREFPLSETAGKLVRVLFEEWISGGQRWFHNSFLKDEADFESDVRVLVRDSGLEEIVIRQPEPNGKPNRRGMWGLIDPNLLKKNRST
jgi:hypothetical protein